MELETNDGLHIEYGIKVSIQIYSLTGHEVSHVPTVILLRRHRFQSPRRKFRHRSKQILNLNPSEYKSASNTMPS